MNKEILVTESVKSFLRELYDVSKNEIKQYVSSRLLEYQTANLEKCLYQKTLLERNKNIHIEDFYIPLFLRPVQAYRNKSSEKIHTFSVANVFKNEANLIIFGSAGSGKSTLVKHLVISAIKENDRFPILIELRNLTTTDGDFNKYVLENIFHYQKLSVTESISERTLLDGKLLFVLDGFDEVKDSMKVQVAESIKQFMHKYGRNNYLITSRHYQPLNSFDSFRAFEICEFTDEERDLFIKTQIKVIEIDPAIGDQIVNELANIKNSSIRQYLTNPLLLSLFIITYLTKKEVPFSKSEFYYNIFDSLFTRLDSNLKHNYIHEKLSGLSKEDFMSLLSSFSFYSFFKQRYEFSRQYFDETIKDIRNAKDLKFNTQFFLTDLLLNVNILVEEGTIIKFPHRSLQEYFAAYFVSKLDYIQKKEFYSQMVWVIINDIFFISILLEIDYVNVIEFIVVPLMESFISNSYNNLADNNVFKRQSLGENAVYDFIMDILEANEKLRNIKDEFETSSFNRIKINADHDSLIDWHQYKNKVLILNFKDNGRVLIQRLNSYIRDLKEQDKKIIDMIKGSR